MSRSGRRSSSSPKDKHALTLDELNPTPRPAKYDQYVTVTPENSSPAKQFRFSKVSYECAVLICPGKIARMCFVVLIMLFYMIPQFYETSLRFIVTTTLQFHRYVLI